MRAQCPFGDKISVAIKLKRRQRAAGKQFIEFARSFSGKSHFGIIGILFIF